MTEHEAKPHDDKHSLAGWVPPMDDPQARQAALDKAFDYRGDVTLTLRDGQTVEGYLYDRQTPPGRKAFVRLMLRDSDERLKVLYDDIVQLAFTGRDTAAGRSWETWVRKYQEKKARGEVASIEPEPLDE
jgi:hypothetical protein